jgi:hypothetical protein
MSKSPFCKEISNDGQIKYSGTIVFAPATVDELRLGGCNDPIAIVVGHAEPCHLPWCVHLVLQLVWQKEK